jgi:protocatechuate 3,4-dioxygenase beta subunit
MGVADIRVHARLVQVLAGPSGDAPFGAIAVSDASGAFELQKLRPGRYSLRAEVPRERARFLSTTYGARRERDLGTLVEVREGTVTRDVVIRLAMAAVINGRVVNETGEPVAYARVTAWLFKPGMTEPRPEFPGHETDDQGRFRLFGLAPGEYVVRAEAEGGFFSGSDATRTSRYLPAFFPSALRPDEAQRILATAEEEVHNVEIVLRRGRTYRISGVVLAAGGGGRRSTVMYDHRENGNGFGTPSGEDGSFSASGLLPGEYTIEAFTEETGDPQVEPERSNPLSLEVQADIDGVTLQMRRGVRVQGRVVFEADPPPPLRDLEVIAVRPDARGGRGGRPTPPAPVRADGTFVLARVFGPSVLRLIGHTRTRLKSVTFKGNDITDVPTEFSEVRDPNDIVITHSDTGAQIVGTVSDSQGKAINEGYVLIFSADRKRWTSWAVTTGDVQLNRSGKFRHEGLRADKYLVAALNPDDRALLVGGSDRKNFERLAAIAVPVEVTENEVREVSLTLARLPGSVQ